MNGQAAHQNGGSRAAGDTKGQQRDQSTAGNRIVRRFGRRNAFHNTGTEQFGVLGLALRDIQADPGGDIAARAGQDTDEHADDGAFKDQRDQMDKFLTGRQEAAADLHDFFLHCFFAAFICLDHNLGNREQTDHGRNQADAAQQTGDAERVAGGAVSSKADQTDDQTEGTCNQALDHVVTRKGGDQGQAENGDKEIFGRTEVQGQSCQRRSNQQQCDSTDDAADNGRGRGNTDRVERFTLLRHGIAVKAGRRGRRRAGRMDQNGGNGTTVHRGGVDSCQHQDGGRRTHAVSYGD